MLDKILSFLADYLTPKSLSKTYTANSYVTEASFGRIRAQKIGGIVVVFGNLNVDAEIPSGQSITIGRINGLGTVVQDGSAMVPSEYGGAINISVDTSGEVKLYKYARQSSPAAGWTRFSMTLVTRN